MDETLTERMRHAAVHVEVYDQEWEATQLRDGAAEIERLREALKPFATHPPFHAPDDWPVTVIDRNEPTGDPVAGVTAGDFRRAAAAMVPNLNSPTDIVG